MKHLTNFKSDLTKLRRLTVLLFLIPMCVSAWGGKLVEGFEAKTAESTYNTTKYITTSESDCGIAWTIYYGCVSTASKISGSNSAALRLYTTANYGYLMSTTDVTGLTKITFIAKAATTNSASIKIDIQYSTDNGSTWSYMKQASASGDNWNAQALTSTAANYAAYIPTAAISSSSNYRIKISINSGSTKPSSGNVQLTIDDIMFHNSSPDIFELVEDASDLSSGDEIIILNAGCTKALGTTQNTNNRSASTDFSMYDKNNIVALTSNTVQTLYLRSSSTNWTLYTDIGYLYAAGSSNNHYLKSRASDNNGESQWSISISETIATIIDQGSNTNNLLQYAPDIFACYSSAQTAVKIYKRLADYCDMFVDEMHDNSVSRQVGSYTMPNISDETKGSRCIGLHYKFIGWVVESDLNDDGTLKSGYTLITPGTAMKADFSTYYAIWGEDAE